MKPCYAVPYRYLRRVLPALLLAVAVPSGSCGNGDPGAALQPPPPPPPPGEANVFVDPSQAFQTINGWEAVIATGWSYSSRLRDAIVDAAVNDLGLNRLRVDATAALEGNGLPGARNGVAVNDNPYSNVVDATKFTWRVFDLKINDWVVPFKRAVEARGEPFVLNVTYVGFVRTSDFHKIPAEYAEFVSVVLNRLRDRWGIEPDLWDVSNEPDNPVVKSGAELGRMMKAAGDRARAEGFNKVRFIAPSVTDADNAVKYLNGIAAIPGIRDYWAEASYHLYRNGATLVNLNAIRDFARRAGVTTSQTEFIGATAEMLLKDLTEADVSSWEQFTLAYPTDDNGAQLYIPAGDGFSLGSRTWFLRQWFRYVRPGAVRLGARSTEEGIQPVAFRNRDGGVVVVANTSGAASLAIAGLPAGTYRVSFNTASARGAAGPRVTLRAGEILEATIPARGTITIAP